MIYLAFTICVFLLLLNYKKKKTLLYYPSSILIIVWIFVYITQVFNNYFSLLKVSDLTIFLSIIPILSVFFGEKVCVLLLRNMSTQKKTSMTFDFEIRLLNIFGVISVVLMYFGLLFVFGNEFYNVLDQIKSSRLEGADFLKSSGIGLLAYSNLLYVPSATSLVLSLIQSKLDEKKLYSALIPLSCIIILDFFLVSRTISYSFTLLYLVVGIVQFQKKLIKVYLMIFILGVVPILTSELSRKNYNYNLPVSVQQLIDYNAGPIIAFDRNFHLMNKPTYGEMSFYGLKEIVNMIPLINFGDPPEEFYYWDSKYSYITNDSNYYQRGLNTFSWLLYLYVDFQLLGLIGTFILGFLSYLFMVNFNCKNSITSGVLYYFMIILFIKSTNEIITNSALLIFPFITSLLIISLKRVKFSK